MATKEKLDPAQEITSEIVALLEKGTMPWRRPWKIAAGGVPMRHNGEGYKGINAFLLGLGYTSPYWMTFNQARDPDACVKKGSRSSIVIYYGTGRKRGAETGDAGGEQDGKESGGSYRFLKSYRVFNEGLDASYHPEPEGDPADGPRPIPEVQAFFDAIDADVVFGGDRACYIPSLDRIHMPDLKRFESASANYSTLFHELGHWTKTKTRLDRSFGVSSFGNEAYSKEELTVEIASVVGGQRLGFAADHFEKHAAGASKNGPDRGAAVCLSG